MADYKYTMEDLRTMQAWPLWRKVQVTQTRIIEWRRRFGGQIYISFSGGKDSTVLADLAARIYSADKDKSDPLTLVFVNTGLEYPEIQKFVRYYADWLRDTYSIPVNLEILRPELSFPEVLSKYGYPVIAKETAKVIYYAKRGSKWAVKRINGLNKDGEPDAFKARYKKYKYLVDAPFDTCHLCCNVMKKDPAKNYEARTGRKPVVGSMTEESEQRQDAWLKYGCNAFDGNRPMSNPMSFWTEQDVLQYIEAESLPLCSVYGEIVNADPQTTLFTEQQNKLKTTKCDRTGCMYCMFGIMSDKEPNRFQRMKETHPRQYEYCIGGGHFEDGILKPDKTGLGLRYILDYIGKPY